MRRTLYIKLLVVYAVLGCLGILATSTIGAKLIENQLIRSESEAIYTQATSIASNTMVRYQTSSANLETIYNSLEPLGTYQGTEIWIVNDQNQIIVNSSDLEPAENPKTVQNFDPTTWGSNYYRIGNFYNNFHYPVMSVIAPITANMTPRGYVVIHYPMSNLYEKRAGILSSVYLIYLMIFGLSLLILAFFSISVYHPLRKIITGADQFALGHLDYEIPVITHDEIGYLAATLNYMSDELANTNETQRNFIANVSHDFRSPLTSIKGYLTAIEDGTIPPEMRGHYIKIIIDETERLEKLTKSLLTLNNLDGKGRIMNFRAFDINKIIKRTVATFEGICRNKKITMELILTGEQLYVYADMEQIQQVLYNLLDNAIKFSPNDTAITIETTEKNDRIFVSVKDRGCGISRENITKIWDRFYKIDASRGKDRKGTGLGLAIVKEIINSHDQNINVISTEGVGTEFIFTLERARD